MGIFLRFLPLLVAMVEVVVFFEQSKHPLEYPWIAGIGVLALPVAAIVIGWGRVRFFDLVEKMTPSFLLLASLAFALLLVEWRVAFWVIVSIAGISSFISLELLFQLAFDPSRYPVNGLSRVNIAYVPLILWYVASTSAGLMTFLHMDRLIHLALLTALGAMLFRTTGHPGASWQQNATWSLIGALVGSQVGLLETMLPISLPMQGMLAALILSAALRTRRYKYDPKPSRRTAIIEGGFATASFIILLSTATWF